MAGWNQETPQERHDRAVAQWERRDKVIFTILVLLLLAAGSALIYFSGELGAALGL